MPNTDFDAVIIGSGPNGLAAAILLQQQGLKVLIVEGKNHIGGGMRSAELTLPGFIHDICSAVHPMAAASPFLRNLPLADYGLHYIDPTVLAAHPLDGGTAAALYKDITQTAETLNIDKQYYADFVEPLVASWPDIVQDILSPLGFPKHPRKYLRFGLQAALPASLFSKRFKGKELKALFAGMAAHSLLDFNQLTTSAIALVLTMAGHHSGWPIVRGGSQQLAQSMAAYFCALGGKIETGIWIKSLEQLPKTRAIFFDTSPKQLLEIAGHRLTPLYKKQLNRYRYGAGLFKIDWALDGPVPFIAESCRQAGTVHIGNTFEEIAYAEKLVAQGKHAEKPFVLFAQQSLFDPSRAPIGKQVAWGYCHVPNGSTRDMSEQIESQIERYAPGFRDLILARSLTNTEDLENYNPNYIGGDVNGGALDLRQLFTRPALRFSPYRTSAKGLYICSASTPPGGGVHGMGGFHAAKCALKDIFHITL